MPPMESRAFPPVLVVVSDGRPTDDFESGLERLLAEPWGRRAVRLAIAIGTDADLDVLARFIGDPEIRPFTAGDPEQLAYLVRFVSTAPPSSPPHRRARRKPPAYRRLTCPRRPTVGCWCGDGDALRIALEVSRTDGRSRRCGRADRARRRGGRRGCSTCSVPTRPRSARPGPCRPGRWSAAAGSTAPRAARHSACCAANGWPGRRPRTRRTAGAAGPLARPGATGRRRRAGRGQPASARRCAPSRTRRLPVPRARPRPHAAPLPARAR